MKVGQPVFPWRNTVARQGRSEDPSLRDAYGSNQEITDGSDKQLVMFVVGNEHAR